MEDDTHAIRHRRYSLVYADDRNNPMDCFKKDYWYGDMTYLTRIIILQKFQHPSSTNNFEFKYLDPCGAVFLENRSNFQNSALVVLCFFVKG